MFVHNGMSNGKSKKIRLLDYQQEAASRINGFLDHNLGRLDDTRHLCLLQGPTGMGKTYTMGSVIASNASRNVAFLWLSPAQGSLALQSFAALSDLLTPKGIAVEYGTADVIASGEALKAHSVTVMNWSLVDKDSNKATKDGEKNNIFDLASIRSSEGVEVVIIVDEAHHAAKKGKKAQAFLNNLASALGYSPVTIEVTATPTSLNEPNAAYPNTEIKVVVDVDNVIDSEMIAKGIKVNSGLAEFQSTMPDVNSAEVILHAALASIEEYRKLLAVDPKAGEWKNPLLLVQVPNGKDGKRYIEMIERVCAQYGITEENGKLGRYLSENKSNTDELDRIAAFDSPIEVLIFKQGIALGWDCPRAKGLVAYRESSNDIFRVQTVGRIVRMPEHKHYENDFLNRAFIYTNLENSLFDFSNSGTGPGYISDKVLSPREGIVLPVDMPTSNWSRAGFQGGVTAERLASGIKDPASVAALAKVSKNLDKIQKTATYTESVLTDIELSTEDVFSESSKTSGVTSEIIVSDGSLEPLFKAALGGILPEPYTNVARSVGVVLPRYVEWFAVNVPEFKDVPSKARRQSIITFLASSDVRDAWAEVLKVCASQEPTTVEHQLGLGGVTGRWDDDAVWEDFTFPMFMPASSDKGVAVGGIVSDLAASYAYVDGNGEPFLESKPSDPERQFMQKVLVGLKNEGRLVWWWKNGESGTSDKTPYFRIPHIRFREEKGDTNRVYPDYIVCYLDATGKERYAVLEVKHGGTGKIHASNEDSRVKAATLGKWAASRTGGTYVAGVVYFDPAESKWKFADTEDKANDKPLDGVLA